MSDEPDNYVDEESLFEEYVKTFFTGTALENMIIYMCNACTMEINDPITHTLLMFLATPVTFMLTDIGLVPFKDMNMAILPYTRMTRQQKDFLVRYLQFLQDTATGTLSTQMGGGCFVTLNRKISRTHNLDNSTVMSVFCETVLESKTHQNIDTRVAICNIVLQHVGTNLGLNRETMQKIHTNVKRVYSRVKAAEEH